MENHVSISKSKLIFEIDSGVSKKALSNLEIENLDMVYDLGFKIKSTNVSRYIVNPVVGIINPRSTVKIDIMLIMGPTDKTEYLEDKFRVYTIVLHQSGIDKTEVNKLIKENIKAVKKYSIPVVIKDLATNILKDRKDITTPFDNMIEQDLNQNTPKVCDSSLSASNLATITEENEGKTNTLKVNDEINLLRKENQALFDSLKAERQLAKSHKIDHHKLGNFQYWKALLVFFLGAILGILITYLGDREWLRRHEKIMFKN